MALGNIMIVHTVSGSTYQFDFDKKLFRRISHTYGNKDRPFDNVWTKYKRVSISPWQAPEQIEKHGIMIEMDDDSQSVYTSYVTSFEYDNTFDYDESK